MGLPDAIRSSKTIVKEVVLLPNVSHIYLKLLVENEKKYPVKRAFKFPFYELVSAIC